MYLSSRSKASIAFTLLAVFTFVGAFTLYSFLGSPSANAAPSAPSVSSFRGTLGSAQLVGQSSIGSLPRVSSTAKPKKYHIAPMKPRPSSSAGKATSRFSEPTAASSRKAAATLLHNFDGVSATQNNQALSGLDFEPPDESIATGFAYVLNFVNLTGAIYTKNGTIAAGPFPLALPGGGGFFHADINNIVSDPRAYYDVGSHTWFALVWEDDFVTTKSGTLPGPAYVDLAVNSESPVANAWTIYKINVTDASAAGCPCLPDFTILGVDQYNVYLLPNEFQNFAPFGFNGSQIYVLAKSQLIAGVTKPRVVHFGGLNAAGVIAYHLQPANEHSWASAEYFMNSLDPNNTFDTRLGVWAMTNRANVANGVIPNLSVTVVNSEAYAMPPNAQTPPGFNAGFSLPTSGIVTNDFDAMQEVQYINGHLYGALDTSINIAGESGARSGIAWFDVKPRLSGGVIASSTTVAAQGYIGAQGLYLLYPHIEVASNGTAAIVFSYGGPGTFLSAAYVVRPSGAKSFGSIHTAAFGAAPDNGFTSTSLFGSIGRWGDYSAGQLDPTGSGIWFATEYIPNNGDQFANWGNRLFEIQA
jgi:hypothetical protein